MYALLFNYFLFAMTMTGVFVFVFLYFFVSKPFHGGKKKERDIKYTQEKIGERVVGERRIPLYRFNEERIKGAWTATWDPLVLSLFALFFYGVFLVAWGPIYWFLSLSGVVSFEWFGMGMWIYAIDFIVGGLTIWGTVWMFRKWVRQVREGSELVRQFLGKTVFFKNCLVLVIPSVMDWGPLPFTRMVIKLTEGNGHPVSSVVEHEAPKSVSRRPDGYVNPSTTHSFSIVANIHFATDEARTMLVLNYLDNIFDFTRSHPHATDNQLKAFFETMLLDEVEDIVAGSLDASIQALHDQGIYLVRMRSRRQDLSEPLKASAEKRLLCYGIAIDSFVIAGLKGSKADQLEREGEQIASNQAEARISIAEREKAETQQQQRNLTEKARQDTEKLVQEREQDLQVERAKAEEKKAYADLARARLDIQTYQTQEASVAAATRQKNAGDPNKIAPGVALAGEISKGLTQGAVEIIRALKA